MEGFFDSVTVKVVGGFVAAFAVFLIYHSFDIYQFLTRRDFGNVNAYYVHFTQYDKGSNEDKIVFELMAYKIPLREICRNRFLFWVIIYHSFKASESKPVLYFGSFYNRSVLAPVRGRVSSAWVSMMLKKAAGLPFVDTPCQLCLVHVRSEFSTNFVLRIMLVPDRDIERYAEYKNDPPMNSNNFELFGKIVEAYKSRDGSFIDVRVTVA